MSKFTPGPWKHGKCGSVVSESVEGIRFTNDANFKAYGGYLVCETVTPSNARLISKAPEMLELLKDLVKTTITWDIHSKSIDEAITLITEIEGETDA